MSNYNDYFYGSMENQNDEPNQQEYDSDYYDENDDADW